ncbi:MAG: prolipoprotein diacylglyceryl transferase family protein [Elusimicrobiota bacterium]
MHPLIELGPIRSTWSLTLLIACAFSLPAMLYEARWRNVEARLVWTAWPGMVFGGLLGAHVYYLLTHSYFLDVDPYRKLFNVFAGMSLQGAFIGGSAAGFLVLRFLNRPVLPMLDVAAPVIALGIAITRLGCLSMGCCYGKPTSLPFGIVFTHPVSPAPHGISLHPTQLYEFVPCLALALLLHLRLKRKKAANGEVAAFLILGYGIIRFLVQPLRNDDAHNLILGLAHGQYMAAAMIAASLWWLNRLGVKLPFAGKGTILK